MNFYDNLKEAEERRTALLREQNLVVAVMGLASLAIVSVLIWWL